MSLIMSESLQCAVELWVERGLPHPAEMGSFLRAVLTNDLKAAAMMADEYNRQHLYEWAVYLHNEMPAPSQGSAEKLLEWHELGGLQGYAAARRAS